MEPSMREHESSAPRYPNVLLVICDDLGHGDLGCQRTEGYDTPHIDRLAARGVRCTEGHSNGVVCSPSRASVLTGRYPARTGVTGVIKARGDREHGLAQDERTLAHVLGAEGYATACIGKWHLGYAPRYNPTRFGFDRFRGYVSGNIDFQSHVDQAGIYDWWEGETHVEETGYVTDLITEHADRFIREHADRPWFCYVAHEAPHYPYQGPGDPPERRPGVVPEVAPGARREDPDAYRAMMQRLDAGVGRLTATLAELGLDRSTLVIFTSDHGAPANAPGSAHNAPWRGGKNTLYEGGHRVPTLFSWPGMLPEGEVCEAPVMGMDLLPTVASAAGAALPEGRPFDGIDALPVLTGARAPSERLLAWQAPWSRAAQAVRAGRWKLIERPENDPPTELYDLETDPQEQTNRAEERPERVADLRARLERLNAEIDGETAGAEGESV
jgi:arylsulfatase A-like enzyme